jgi:hypothetical protein
MKKWIRITMPMCLISAILISMVSGCNTKEDQLVKVNSFLKKTSDF